MSLFLISAIRAIVEMLGLCLIGQGVLYILAGKGRQTNRIFQLFGLLTGMPRRVVAKLLPGSFSQVSVGVLSFILLLGIWLGLAFIRKSI